MLIDKLKTLNKPKIDVIKDGIDHNFSQSMDEFMKLPFEYLLK